MSDTHDNAERTEAALSVFDDRGVGAVLHMGDLTSPSMVETLAGRRVWIVEGNVDRAPDRIAERARTVDGDVRYDDAFTLELDGARVGLCHGHDDGRMRELLAGDLDLVCHGHTHEFRDETVGGTRVVNPGALHRTSAPSVGLYETGADDLERVYV